MAHAQLDPKPITIITNNAKRDLLSGWELTDKERAEFDYIENFEECGNIFFRYRGSLYDTGEFVRTPQNEPFDRWDGVQPDTYFSGILIRYTNDFESVVVARYFS